MKFGIKLPTLVSVVIWTTLTISIIGLAVSIAALCGVPIEITPAQAKLLIATFSLTAVISTLFVTIHYKIQGNKLKLNIACIDMLSGRINIDSILNIVIDKDKMYISYIWKGADPIIAAIMIHPKRFEEMKNLLMSQNKNIVYYNKNDETTDSEQQ